MKRILYISVLICCLASCARQGLPSFSTSADWRQRGNVVENSDMKVQFGGDGLLSNAGNGEYELNFITSEAEFNAYEPKLAKYLTDVIKQIPLRIDSIDVIFADEFLILTTSGTNTWEPDYVRRADKAVLTVQGHPIESFVQPEDELWRNLIINKSKRQIIVVDRLIKNDRHYAIVYVLQSDSKNSPFSANYHYDITNPRNIQSVGANLEALMNTSVDALESDGKAVGYNDYIMRADNCYMNGDFEGASLAFEKAFKMKNEIQGRHLYNAACAAARAGFNDIAFERLFALLEKELNWYVDDPNRDKDLEGLHRYGQWKTFCNTVIARRDRIQAHYDKPLRKKLQEIGQSDQKVRYEYLNAYNQQPRNDALIDSLRREMVRVDSINQNDICNILDTKGFVGKDKVGEACAVFWVIIQHAPVEIEKKYFPLFVEAAQRGDIAKSQVALMDDRIAMFEGRPQKYGTQIVENAEGKRVVYNLLDPSQVDQWRQEMDLNPLNEYMKQMGVEQ